MTGLLRDPSTAGASEEVPLLVATDLVKDFPIRGGVLGRPIGTVSAVAGVSISVTPSIGVAIFPQDGVTPAGLIQHADQAMYRAKTGGGARYRFFEPGMAEAALSELALESRLAQAVLHDEFVLHFQPQVSPRDGRLLGMEALVRWAHPQRGLVAPEEFIPLAERRRLILPIGQWVLRQALQAALRWRQAGWPALPVAVNLSTQQFQTPAFADAVEAVLAETGATGGQLELELTERMLMEDQDAVRESLLRLKTMGVVVTVDDFGTGYTSLAQMKDLPLDRLKIGRSFVCGLPHERGAVALARAIAEMGRGLGLQVVAEGVETEAQAQWVREQGCHALQGFIVAPPMPELQLHEWLRQRRSQG